jgi:hypothetical protein
MGALVVDGAFRSLTDFSYVLSAVHTICLLVSLGLESTLSA